MPTAELDTLLHDAEIAHGHLCAGQILGVRMAVLACRLLDIHDPRSKESPDRKRLVTFVEIDRCATDAIAVVTGCRVGKRALKLRDWGKMAATFLDLARPIAPEETDGRADFFRALRVVALESSKQRAREIFPEVTDRNQQQMRAYRDLPDVDLFSAQWVSVYLPASEFPGFRGARVTCSVCGKALTSTASALLRTLMRRWARTVEARLCVEAALMLPIATISRFRSHRHCCEQWMRVRGLQEESAVVSEAGLEPATVSLEG